MGDSSTSRRGQLEDFNWDWEGGVAESPVCAGL